MGIDGFSLANLGLNLNKTSSALASEADVLALQGNENQIKDVDGITKKQKAQRKDKDGAFNGGTYLPGEEPIEPVQDNAKNNKEPQKQSSPEDYSNYRFRLNREKLIEIFDSKTDEIIRTIEPEDAIKVLMNITDVPGIVVNEKV